MRIAIYSRKSVYTGKGESIENQIEMCKQYIFSKIQGVTEQDITIYEDEGFSAKNTDRPQFQKLLKDIKEKKYNYVVCYRLDRISRNVSDFATLIEDLNNLGVSFICIKEEFDTSKPMGKAMMFIASVFAQLERETIAERVRDNMFMLARTGRWLGGTPPTGFQSEKTEQINIDGKAKTTCKLKFKPDEIGIIKIMFEKFLELQSVSGVSKYLIANNLKSRTGKYFSLPGIKEIISNPVYCIADHDAREYFLAQDSDVCFKEDECSDQYGLLSYNKRDYKKKHAPRQAMSEWIIAIGKHRGIVSGRDWISTQNTLEANKPSKREVKAHNDYSLLSGMIYCTKCGEKMFAKTRYSNAKLFDYICGSKMRGGMKLCDCQNLNGRKMDDMVCDYLMQFINEQPRSKMETHQFNTAEASRETSNLFIRNESAVIDKLLGKLKTDIQTQAKEDPIAALDFKINKCNTELDSLANTLSQPNLAEGLMHRINAKATGLSRELEQLVTEKNRLQMDITLITDDEIQPDRLATALSSLKTCFKQLTIREKRQLIKLIIQKIEWDGKNLHIFMYGQ